MLHVIGIKMKFERTTTIVSAIAFILLQGLISTEQFDLASTSKRGVSKEYDVPVEGDAATYPLTESISSSGGEHQRLIRKREATSGAEGKNDSSGGDASNKGAKKLEGSGSVKVGVTKAVLPTPKQHTLFIPDRSPNGTLTQMKDESFSEEEEDNRTHGLPGQGNFDEKAIQRAMVVIGGIVLIIIAYLGVKFFLIKKTKVAKRYGRIESSEMDLLDEVEDEEESEEEEELFDINQQRRS